MSQAPKTVSVFIYRRSNSSFSILGNRQSSDLHSLALGAFITHTYIEKFSSFRCPFRPQTFFICLVDLGIVRHVSFLWQQIFNEFTRRVVGIEGTFDSFHFLNIVLASSGSFHIQNTFGKYWYDRKLFKMRNSRRPTTVQDKLLTKSENWIPNTEKRKSRESLSVKLSLWHYAAYSWLLAISRSCWFPFWFARQKAS